MPAMLKTIVCLFSSLLTVAVSYAAETSESEPPNIVLIISDDQGFTDYGFMGHPHIKTPSLDRLARESTVFRRGYVPTALCRPSLMTLVTGLYAHQNLTTGNDPSPTPANKAHAKKSGKDIREVLISHIDKTGALPQWLSRKGYASHQSGKWWEGAYQRAGFTEGMSKGFPNKGGRHGDAGLAIGRDEMETVTQFIDRSVADKKPFFVWYAPVMPHTPHNPPARLLDKYLEKGIGEYFAKYYAMCEWFDETCGALIDHIDNKGIKENTLIIYVTDNGWIQNESKRGFAARSKRSPYELGTRTPIMFRWPGTIPATERSELCSSIDFVPTILAAAGAKGPHKFLGLNLLPELKSGEKIGRDTLYGEAFAHDIADIEKPQASLLHRWVIQGHDKLLLTYDGAQGRMRHPIQNADAQLYDLKVDPKETKNLASKKAERVRELSKLLDKWYEPKDRVAGRLEPAGESAKQPQQKTTPQAKEKKAVGSGGV